MEQKYSFTGNPEAITRDIRSAGYLRGLAGALLGALVGALPWFLVEVLAERFVAFLGTVIGLAALYGYKKFGGARKTVYACAVISACALLMVVLSDFAANMIVLVQDAECKSAAQEIGVPAWRVAFWVLTDPENFSLVVRDLLLGAVFALFGVFLMFGKIKEYAAGAEPRPIDPTPEEIQMTDDVAAMDTDQPPQP